MREPYQKQLCKVCGGIFSVLLHATDKMYGKTEKYTYGQCQSCQCLECLDVPDDLSAHYPKEYYSFKNQPRTGFKKLKRSLKIKLIFNHPNFLSPLIKTLTKNYEKFWIYRKIGIQAHQKILDVGTGTGEHILELKDAGFQHAIGIDPFIQADVVVNGVIIVKKSQLTPEMGKFDLITFHHSLEHMKDQIGILRKACECLTDSGQILIRVPTVTSNAFEEYKENWFQLDAPRHMVLHSHKSIKLAAEKASLKITSLWCDSNELQFIISEQFKSGIFGNSSLSYFQSKSNKPNKEKLRRLIEKTKQSNQNLMGDQICLTLKNDRTKPKKPLVFE